MHFILIIVKIKFWKWRDVTIASNIALRYIEVRGPENSVSLGTSRYISYVNGHLCKQIFFCKILNSETDDTNICFINIMVHFIIKCIIAFN